MFWINVPLGVAALALGLHALTEPGTRVPTRTRLDLPGALSAGAALPGYRVALVLGAGLIVAEIAVVLVMPRFRSDGADTDAVRPDRWVEPDLHPKILRRPDARRFRACLETRLGDGVSALV